MEKRKRILLIFTLSALIITLIIGIIYQKYYYKDSNTTESNKKNETPIITNDYSIITSSTLLTYNNANVYYNNDTKYVNLIRDNMHYHLGVFGELYTTPILYTEDNYYDDFEKNELARCNNYSVFADDDDRLYLYDRYNNRIKNYYTYIKPIIFDEDTFECKYILLENEYESGMVDYYIFDTINEKMILLDENIIYAGFADKNDYSASIFGLYITNSVNKSNLIVEDKNEKYGLIDYEGNYVIEPCYDGLYIEGEDLFVAVIDNKYGLIDKNNNILLNIEYDAIRITDNYIIVANNGKLTILDKQYNVISDSKIIYDNKPDYIYYTCCAELNTFKAYEKNNNLIIQTISSNDYNDEGFITQEEYDKYMYIYIINKSGAIKKIKGYSDYFDDITCITNRNGSIINYTFYDNKFNLLVVFSLEASHPELQFSSYAYLINRDYWKLSIEYNYESNIKSDIECVNIENKESVSEFDTQYYYFDNGYGYVYKNNKLSIYKKKEVIYTIDDITSLDYIGNYMFAINKNNDANIIKIIFN